MLLAAACMWALDRWLPLALWVAPPWNRLGALPFLFGLGIDVSAIVCFRRARTTVNPLQPHKATQLVIAGPFRFSRNPMYLGLLLQLAGWALWLGSASPWLVLPVLVSAITALQIIPEERALAQLFGEQYAEYKGKVARWCGGAARV